MFRHWRISPPVHLLVAAYLGFKGDPIPDKTSQSAAEDDDNNDMPAWMQGMKSLPAPDAVRQACTPEEAHDAFTRMHFGEMHVYK